VLTIGIVGSRRRHNSDTFEAIEREFNKFYVPGQTIICSGLCPQGADAFAVTLSNRYTTGKLWFPADWKRYGRGAGFMRNTYIAQYSDILIASPAPDRKGGTEDTIKKFVGLKGKDNLILV